MPGGDHDCSSMVMQGEQLNMDLTSSSSSWPVICSLIDTVRWQQISWHTNSFLVGVCQRNSICLLDTASRCMDDNLQTMHLSWCLQQSTATLDSVSANETTGSVSVG